MRWGENIITEKGGTVIDKSQVACPAPEVLCQDMVSTPGAQLNSHFIQHYGDNKPYFIINFWKPGL